MFGARNGFKVFTGALYLGGYIRDYEYKRNRLREHTLTWENNIGTIRKTVEKYPQESYAVVARTIQSEWIFMQHVTWETGDASAGVEKILREIFLPRLLFRKKKHFLTHRRSSKYNFGQ